ncbi:MAG TPA: hypothetical protein VK714_03685 [Myxococcota bacterium]|nr:hypothetical protein [Myxococcota bacterium]
MKSKPKAPRTLDDLDAMPRPAPPADPKVKAFLDALADGVAAQILAELRSGQLVLSEPDSESKET